MTLEQLHSLKRWHLSHAEGHRVELALCNLMLGAWLVGWMLLLPLAALGAWTLLPLSLLLTQLPMSYHRLRERLHRRGRLRCDWLCAVTPSTSPR